VLLINTDHDNLVSFSVNPVYDAQHKSKASAHARLGSQDLYQEWSSSSPNIYNSTFTQWSAGKRQRHRNINVNFCNFIAMKWNLLDKNQAFGSPTHMKCIDPESVMALQCSMQSWTAPSPVTVCVCVCMWKPATVLLFYVGRRFVLLAQASRSGPLSQT